MSVRVIGPGCAIAVVGTTLVVRDITAPTPSTVEGLAKAFREVVAAQPGGIMLLYITGPSETGELPDEASRRAVLETLREHKMDIRAIGYVVLLRGILAATMRSVGSALLYAARIQLPTRIFGDLEDGMAWIKEAATKIGVSSPDIDELRATADALLDRLNADLAKNQRTRG